MFESALLRREGVRGFGFGIGCSGVIQITQDGCRQVGIGRIGVGMVTVVTHIVDIVLDKREEVTDKRMHMMRLRYPPLYVLVSMNRTKAHALDRLTPGILPVAPLTRTFVVTTPNGKRTSISRQQLPITPAYAFTDYCAQAQTIEHCVVDIGKPPYGQLTPFNAYIALSQSQGRDTI